MIPSRATALRCADLCWQSYLAGAPRPWVRDETADGVTLVFAGTRDAHDVAIDAEAWKVKPTWAHGCGVHKGFSGLCDDLFTNAHTDASIADGGLVTITGHSLGAALALLTAYRLALLAPRLRIQVVAFGCPRVGGPDFHAFYHARAIPTLRVTCAHDPVAHSPGLLRGIWRHVGDGLHIDEDGTPLADPETMLGKIGYWLSWDIGHLDHSMRGYQAALMRHAARGYEWPT